MSSIKECESYQCWVFWDVFQTNGYVVNSNTVKITTNADTLAESVTNTAKRYMVRLTEFFLSFSLYVQHGLPRLPLSLFRAWRQRMMQTQPEGEKRGDDNDWPSVIHGITSSRTITTASFWPSPVPTRRRISSGTLRGTSWIALADEWDQITGALVCMRAWRAVSSDVWERSTKTPMRFISSIRERPRGLHQWAEWHSHKQVNLTSNHHAKVWLDPWIHMNPQMRCGTNASRSCIALQGHNIGEGHQESYPVDVHYRVDYVKCINESRNWSLPLNP